MPAVIQLQDCSGDFPTFAYAVRDEALFALAEWRWSPDSADAYVFPDYPAADAKAKELGAGLPQRQFCYAATREAAIPLRGVEAVERGVSPAEMAAGTVTERIVAAKQNKRVAQARRSAEVSPAEAYALLEKRHLD